MFFRGPGEVILEEKMDTGVSAGVERGTANGQSSAFDGVCFRICRQTRWRTRSRKHLGCVENGLGGLIMQKEWVHWIIRLRGLFSAGNLPSKNWGKAGPRAEVELSLNNNQKKGKRQGGYISRCWFRKFSREESRQETARGGDTKNRSGRKRGGSGAGKLLRRNRCRPRESRGETSPSRVLRKSRIYREW